MKSLPKGRQGEMTRICLSIVPTLLCRSSPEMVGNILKSLSLRLLIPTNQLTTIFIHITRTPWKPLLKYIRKVSTFYPSIYFSSNISGTPCVYRAVFCRVLCRRVRIVSTKHKSSDMPGYWNTHTLAHFTAGQKNLGTKSYPGTFFSPATWRCTCCIENGLIQIV